MFYEFEHFRGVIWPRPSISRPGGGQSYRYVVVGMLVTDAPIERCHGPDGKPVNEIVLCGSACGLADVVQNAQVGVAPLRLGDATSVLLALHQFRAVGVEGGAEGASRREVNMFLCDSCRKNCRCLDVFRSYGPCELCKWVVSCLDCHCYSRTSRVSAVHDYWPDQERPAADGAHALYGVHAANAGVWVRGRARTFEPEVNVFNGVVFFLVAGGSLPWRFHFSAVEFARYRSGYAAQPESVRQAREALGAWVLHYWGAFDLHAAREDARAALVCEIMETLRLRSQGESRRRADETVRLFESRRRLLLGPWSSGVQDAWYHYARLLGCDVGECS